MAVLLGFAFLSGVITILSPCILPVLPIVLAAGANRGRARPLGVVAGFVASFAAFSLALTAIVQLLGIPADALRIVAVVLIVLSGLVMVIPRLQGAFEMLASRLGSRRGAAQQKPGSAAQGFLGGVFTGVGLGLIWTPCVGPIMASVLSLALTRHVDGGAVLIITAYSMGTAVPMFAAMVGGRGLLRRVPALERNSGRIQRGLGVLVVVMGLVIGLGWDKKLQVALLSAFPGYGTGLTAVEDVGAVRKALAARSGARAPAGTMMAAASAQGAAGRVFTGVADEAASDGALGDYGRAPDFVTQGAWLNTGGPEAAAGGPALRMSDLRGKVVLIDFWTYSCVNCVRTIPYLRAWYQAYREKGLVIVGVHSPEFEKSTANVAKAIRELGVTWPVVQDNDYAQWNAYGNRYWPAHYLIDAEGRVRAYHFGEGDYAGTEKAIQALLRETGSSVGGIVSGRDTELSAQTPETYLGSLRARGLVSEERLVPGTVVDFRAPRTPGSGEWSLRGRWEVTEEYVIPESTGELELGFQARDVYLVIEPEAASATIRIEVDGGPSRDTEDARGGAVTAFESRLYHLVGLDEAGSHLLRLQVQGRARLYAFTFG